MRLLVGRLLAVVLVVVPLIFGLPGSIGAESAPVSGETTVGDVTVYRDVQYGEADGVDLLLDVYVPEGEASGPLPAVLVIHGGGWRWLSKQTMAKQSEHLAQAGFVVFNVDYRLAPPGGEWHAPVPVEDVRQALLWVRANAEDYGADPTRVGALGSSAGANLALLLATTGEPGADRVDVAVSWSGPTDLLTLADYRDNAVVENYVGCEPAACPDRWTAASPIEQVDRGDAPIYLANSTDELIPLDQATRMAEALDEAGVPHQLRVLKGQVHAQLYSDEVWDESVAFLRSYLGE